MTAVPATQALGTRSEVGNLRFGALGVGGSEE
jgi:hypothetical protein